jgi:hypothetical protein
MGRIKPSHPRQNGRHERMHLTLKKEATKPAAANFLMRRFMIFSFSEAALSRKIRSTNSYF